MNRNDQDRRLWDEAVIRLAQEVTDLPVEERAWIGERLARIAALQDRLQRLSAQADGAMLCQDCGGECCGCGRHHLTLVNLLAFLLPGEEPPVPDFARTCPFLADCGCRLPPARRPFNCITFNCEVVEERLPAADRDAFYAIERELRELYLAFDRRYAGSSLRGFLLRATALGRRRFLDRI